MGLFDGIFNTKPQEAAAQAQIAGLTSGATAATGDINAGQQNVNTDVAAAVAPANINLGTYQPAQDLYFGALGAAGQPGYQAAVDAFHTSPGYQFSLDQGTQNLLRSKNQLGTLASGGTEADLQTLGIGTADQEFQKWLANLAPSIGASGTAAGQVASAETAKMTPDAALAGKLSDIDWSKFTGIGNAQANADLAQTNVSGNILNTGVQGLKFAAGLIPFL